MQHDGPKPAPPEPPAAPEPPPPLGSWHRMYALVLGALAAEIAFFIWLTRFFE